MQQQPPPSPVQKILDTFRAHVKYTFGQALHYVGTTTTVHGPSASLRDIDLLVVVRRLEESHVVHLWRIIRKLAAQYNLILDTRLYSIDQLDSIPLLNKYLLLHFLTDLIGKNPYADLSYTQQELQAACRDRIHQQQGEIVRLLPRVANTPEHLRAVAQSVYDAIRGYLTFVGTPQATKEAAHAQFQKHFPEFPEATLIYQAYLDPGSVFDVSEFLVSASALVRHLLYKTRTYTFENAILLVNSPPAILSHPRDDYLANDQNMPLGLLCVASYLKKHGITTRILDSYAENLGALDTVDRIFATDTIPRIVGFNTCSPNIHIVHRISRYLKRILPDIKILCGGPHATLAPQHTLSDPSVDIAVLGEGEKPALSITQAWLSKTALPIRGIPGVAFRDETRPICTPPERLSESELSLLPCPDLSLLPLGRYFNVRKRIYLHTSRGCSFKCVYCSVPQSLGQSTTTFPTETIIQHLVEYIARYAPTELQIVDDNFSHKKGRLIRAFCAALRNHGISIRWKCQARADQLNKQTIGEMSHCGCFEIDLGVESGNTDIQEYIQKRLDLTKTLSVVRDICSVGITTKAFFMLGFPRETASQITDTINYAISLKAEGLHDVAFFPVMPFPGTRISQETGLVVFQGAVIDEAGVTERSFAADRLRKYSAKPEVSLNSLFTPDTLRFLVRFAYSRFEASRIVTDLDSEFTAFVEQVEAQLYGD